MLQGFTPPFSPTGRSSLVQPPPWHYAGQVLSLAFATEPSRAGSLLPDGFGRPTGRAYGHFCEWQATTDGSELLDPVYAQYKEFFVLVEAERDGAPVLFCPFIYVDQDISMARGLLQGWPKKMGSVWMTRSYDDLGRHPAAAGRRSGQRLGASLAVKDRRLAEAEITVTGEAGERLGFLSVPTLGLVAQSSIVGGVSCGPKRLVRAAAEATTIGTLTAGLGHLHLHESPRDELALLRPLGPVTASIGTLALTVVGATEVARS